MAGSRHSECSSSKNSGAGSSHEAVFKYFERMIDNCCDYALASKKAGRGIVGIYCEYTPRELILAAGAVPVCMCAGSAETIPAAEEDLPSNLCPIIKSAYGYAKLKSNPFFEMADMLVAETTCDGKKKMYELLSDYKDIHVLELAQKSDSNDSFKLWKSELARLIKKLEKKFNTKITKTKLREAIKVMNQERRLRRAIASGAQSRPSLISGGQVLLAKSNISAIESDNQAYRQIIKYIKTNRVKHYGCLDGPRIVLTGVPMPYGAEKVLQIIESCGGVVVAQESCTGLKPLYEDIDEKKDPLTAIAEKYFHLPCSCMTPNTERLQFLSELIRDSKAEAVIEVIWRACHTYNVEARIIQNHVEKEHALPYLKIESDYSQSDTAQLKVRIQALMEVITHRRTV